jgi:hypothetical protein
MTINSTRQMSAMRRVIMKAVVALVTTATCCTAVAQEQKAVTEIKSEALAAERRLLIELKESSNLRGGLQATIEFAFTKCEGVVPIGSIALFKQESFDFAPDYVVGYAQSMSKFNEAIEQGRTVAVCKAVLKSVPSLISDNEKLAQAIISGRRKLAHSPLKGNQQR